MALEIALAGADAEGIVLQASSTAGGADHRVAECVDKHEIDQVLVLTRAMGIVAGGARRVPALHMCVMRERVGLVVDEKVTIVALVAEFVALKRFLRGIIHLVLSLQDRAVR